MGLLNSDIGFRLGQLAGGLWAKDYIERGEAKKEAAAQTAYYDQTCQNRNDLDTDLNADLGINRAETPFRTDQNSSYPTYSTPDYLAMLGRNRW